MPGGKGCPMKKSKNKYSPWPAVALCLVFLALRIVDLALFTDLETSFPTVGPSAARWGTALVGAAALLVMGRRADEKIAPGRKSLIDVYKRQRYSGGLILTNLLERFHNLYISKWIEKSVQGG